jgi:cellulose biosynthesis protein BcsQ
MGARHEQLPTHSHRPRDGTAGFLRPGPWRPEPPGRPDNGGSGQLWQPAGAHRVLLISDVSAIREAVTQVAAAASLDAVVRPTVGSAMEELATADVILLGEDIREVLPRRLRPTMLVGMSGRSSQLWQRASAVAAERVVLLPEGSQWLAEYLSGLQDPVKGGLVVGVLGGCGGAGASTAAVLLAAHAARSGVLTLLVDGDARGGGLDVTLGAEGATGLRWPDLLQAVGMINAAQLAAALPVVAGFSLLAGGKGTMPTLREVSGVPANGHAPAAEGDSSATFGSISAAPGGSRYGDDGGATPRSEVLAAARRGYHLVIVDVGRSSADLRTMAACDRLVLVTPARSGAVLAATRMVQSLPLPPTYVVVREPLPEGWDGELVARALGLPFGGVLPLIRSLPGTAERGELATLAGHRKARRFGNALLSQLQGDHP